MVPGKFSPVLKLPRNRLGRDFVVGDVHGALGLLLAALQKVAFDTQRDRLLCVGDLVDRGAAGAECLALLHEPWVWSVRGNHEQMALDAFEPDGAAPADSRVLAQMQRNGMGWWLGQTPTARLAMLSLIERLPFAIEIDTPRGTVGILHADVPAGMDWAEFTARLEALDNTTLQTCLWGRQRLEGNRHEGVPGVGRIFVGHTPQWGQLRRYGNVYAVDTGAVFGQLGHHPQGALALTNVLTATSATAQPRQPIELLSVLDEPSPAAPFGQGPKYITRTTGGSNRPWLS